MRLILYPLGILALYHTDFSSPQPFFSVFLPLVDFVFVTMLLFDLFLFIYRLEDNGLLDGLEAERPDLWQAIYCHWLERYDEHGLIGGGWRALGAGLELALLLVGLVQAFVLILRAIMETGW